MLHDNGYPSDVLDAPEPSDHPIIEYPIFAISHVGVIHFLRSFISSLRGDHFVPPWGFLNPHGGI